MTEIDYRFAARRRQVAEVHARSRFSKLMWLLALCALGAVGIWFLRSPMLAINQVLVSGIADIEIAGILQQAGVAEGRPMASVRSIRVEEALLEDPRIKQASVSLEWPQRVVVKVSQRRPVAWASVGGAWSLVGEDGVALSSAPQPSSGFPRLELVWTGDPGPEVLGGLAFLSELDPLIAARTMLIEVGGELWAMIDGVNVRLGRPIAMESKARALEAVLAQGIQEGATINLIAPARPAVGVPEAVTTTTNSQAQVKP